MTARLVTAIIPAYNAERWITTTIHSVLAQTWRDLECLVVDDGSEDGTSDLVRSFGEEVRLIRLPNGGVSRARNAGIAAARGTFVAFLDADDAWAPHKLERQMELFQRHPQLGLVYTSLALMDEAGRPLGIVRAPEPTRALHNVLLFEPPAASLAQSGLMPARILADVGGFDERLSTSADADMFCRIALAYPVARIDEPLTFYRQHHHQMHHDLRRVETDMQLVMHKHLDSAALALHCRFVHRRAKSNLALMLAVAHASRGQWASALLHGAQGLLWHPGRALSLIVKRLVRRGRHVSARQRAGRPGASSRYTTSGPAGPGRR